MTTGRVRFGRRAMILSRLASTLLPMTYAGADPTTSEATTIRAVVAHGVLAQPPGQFVYSNVGYIIVGAILEQRSATSWEALMRTELFATLRMDSAGFGAPGDPAEIDQPWGHLNALEPISPGSPASDNPPAFGPTGTVHCALADWGKFLFQHLAGARGEPSLLTSATMTRLHQPPPGGHYAAGWFVETLVWANGLVLTHTGSNTMWTAITLLEPSTNLIFAVVTNRGDDPTYQTTADVLRQLTGTYT